MRTLFLGLSSLSLLACVGTGTGDTSGFDTAADTGATTTDSSVDTGTDSPVDTADSEEDTTTTTPVDTHDSGEDTEPPPPPPTFWELGDPCNGEGTPQTMYFEDSLNGWIGCGNGIGLWQTIDGGDSFSEGHPDTRTKELYVMQLLPDPSGGMLLCGHDYAYAKTLVYRYQNGQWYDLLHYGSNDGDPTSTQFSNCGVLAAAGDGTLIAASNTAGDLSTSTDNGATWTKEFRYWEDENLAEGGYSYYYMLNLQAAGGQYYGAGSDITAPPTFFGPTQASNGSWYNFHATVIDPRAQGEVWALATLDDGKTWFAGGRDQRFSAVASGFFYRSEDGGATWTSLPMGGDLDVMHDVKFASDGLHGIAVGHRYPPGSHGGYILLTEDGGQTWVERTESVPPLYTAAIVGDTWWVGGDAYLARGVF